MRRVLLSGLLAVVIQGGFWLGVATAGPPCVCGDGCSCLPGACPGGCPAADYAAAYAAVAKGGRAVVTVAPGQFPGVPAGVYDCWTAADGRPLMQARPAAPGVAAARPFGQGSGTTPATTAPCAGGACSSRPAPARSPAPTYTGAPLTGLSGITSGGCAGGACGAPQPAYQRGGFLFRR